MWRLLSMESRWCTYILNWVNINIVYITYCITSTSIFLVWLETSLNMLFTCMSSYDARKYAFIWRIIFFQIYISFVNFSLNFFSNNFLLGSLFCLMNTLNKWLRYDYPNVIYFTASWRRRWAEKTSVDGVGHYKWYIPRL